MSKSIGANLGLIRWEPGEEGCGIHKDTAGHFVLYEDYRRLLDRTINLEEGVGIFIEPFTLPLEKCEAVMGKPHKGDVATRKYYGDHGCSYREEWPPNDVRESKHRLEAAQSALAHWRLDEWPKPRL